MAISNSNVATRIMQFVSDHMQGKAPKARKCVTGSNFSAWFNPPSPSVADFHPIATVVSYQTEIARIVVNRANPEPIYELWVTTNRYSPTTDRQMSHLRAAHRAFKPAPMGEPLPVYSVHLEANLPHRCSSNRLYNSLRAARTQRNLIDRPKIHPATRLTHYRHAVDLLEEAIRTTAADVPRRTLESFVDTTKCLDEATEMHAQLMALKHLTVDEMRVAVRAMVALERH